MVSGLACGVFDKAGEWKQLFVSEPALCAVRPVAHVVAALTYAERCLSSSQRAGTAYAQLPCPANSSWGKCPNATKDPAYEKMATDWIGHFYKALAGESGPPPCCWLRSRSAKPASLPRPCLRV